MKKKYITETLLKIQEINESVHNLYKLGVNIIDLENGVSQLEKSIAAVLRDEEDKELKYIQDLVGWWLYEGVEKIIWHDEDSKMDLSNIEDFVDYLIREYGKDSSSTL